ncbi:MAG: M48 family metalloprotease [Abitibacteriaceae bacterium]|nr:M48 family metalloprotease [Abditibacteriaceae bacterium]MBV9864325.1 M48 family metalloprotease [Abditibacteriaceae bacterium]
MTYTTMEFWRQAVVPCLLALGILGGTEAKVHAAPTPHADALVISEKEEIETGKRIAAEASYMYGSVLPDDNPLSVRVRRIGMALAKLSNRRHIPYTYQVLDNNTVPNAFSIGGGPVFITKKLVSMTSNDAELAYVLGHETGHIDRKHMVTDMEKQRRAVTFARSLGQAFGRGGNILGGISYIAFSFWSLGYSRNQETEADLVGVRLMSKLGYDPHAALNMLDKFDKIYPNSAGGYLSTHPAAKDREARIEQLISDEKLMDVAEDHGGPRFWTDGVHVNSYLPRALAIKASQHLKSLAHNLGRVTLPQ